MKEDVSRSITGLFLPGQTGVGSCNARILVSRHSLSTLSLVYYLTSQGCREVDSFGSDNYLCRKPCSEDPKLQVYCDILQVRSTL